MGIRRPICEQCDYIKDTLKHKCKYPEQHGSRMEFCSGRVPYKSLVNAAAEYVIRNYKTFR